MHSEYIYRVGARDTDLFGQCRPSAVMDILQEAATSAASQLHLSREETIERFHAFWMLARIWYRLDAPILWEDTITVRTWHRGGKGASMYRDFDLYRDGVRIGEAVSVWVLADLDTHRLFRFSNAPEFTRTTGGDLCKTKTLSKLHMPGQLSPAASRDMHYSDCDVNGHVNNVRYADLTCDVLDLQTRGKGQYVSSLQLGYLKECKAGETLRLSTGQVDGIWYVRGDGPDGVPRFDAALELSPIGAPAGTTAG